ncbi:cardiolipin synthase [Weeksella virosa]|uniref:Cardiolipin synthase n=1 Tax=Weeksella virosa (strain ATCC 43766 / DSM 16922 / JCM 21250 / CCUG 30538 / CDC 9751 / IAM 14551 / NBRC 16016 / NCTC 11634 / CL345/78) TaxID=865938 RepID=F0P2B5_WEEVC|nr:cardiolipin synthase [Weeksella virosa]ADX67805.1 phospholipase D/Transphosphatidylase [Weeksella virosa DSM 16922]MDK7374094.1 cardiolipin synthase [Weeksella virosa]MDK7674349.1 cardiolipin synthase [Weeksella virosa]SUP54105.1 Cardiolipin synthase [Weeksella virosa]VEH64568.1 Cardiolipin synthase [Weeksella virosa]
MAEATHILHQLWQFLVEWYWIPLTLIYLVLILTILIENRKPEKTIAWILVIVFLPIIGLLFYFFFGQKFNKEKTLSRIDTKQQRQIIERWHSISSFNSSNQQLITEQTGNFSKVFQYLYHSLSSPSYLDNQLEVLINGEEKFPRFLEVLRQAKHHIHLEYYIFELDQIGQEVIEILKNKAANGVIVRIIVDGFGSPKLIKKAKKIFEDSLIQCQTFLPVHFSSLANSNYRNHRKIMIVDAEIAFVGGINISDRYINTPPYSDKNKLYWRDTSLCIRGESVDMLELQFWLSWSMTQGQMYSMDEAEYHFPEQKITYRSIESVIGFSYTSPGSDVPSAMESMILAISLAKEKICITTPYFIPSDEFKSALLIAVSSGVEVNLILPEKGDSFIVQQASLSFLKSLMKRGVNVHLYQKGFIHAKTITVDNEIAFVGTVNLDNRSFFINFEITAVFYDKKAIKKLYQQFKLDLLDTRKITYQQWKSIPMIHRGIASLCRLLAPLL